MQGQHMVEVRVGGCYNNNILNADLGTIYNLKSQAFVKTHLIQLY